MKTQSAKAKGRNLQKWVRDKLIKMTGLTGEDIRSTSMGAGGEDIQLSSAARKLCPFSFECKAVEKLNVYSAYKQAEENCGEYEPVVVHKRNRHKPLITLDAEVFLKLCIKK